MKEKNPQSIHKGWIALHLAAEHGHLEVCKLLIGKLENKNPSNVLGWTPLHAAAKNGHGEICKLIASNIVNKNPVSNDGQTPYQLWLSFGSVFQ
jgi:ankyrin repeat protein